MFICTIISEIHNGLFCVVCIDRMTLYNIVTCVSYLEIFRVIIRPTYNFVNKRNETLGLKFPDKQAEQVYKVQFSIRYKRVILQPILSNILLSSIFAIIRFWLSMFETYHVFTNHHQTTQYNTYSRFQRCERNGEPYTCYDV